MLDDPSANLAVNGRVVHLVGRLTEDVFGLLGPASAVLTQSCVDQTIILIDDPTARRLLTGFDASIELILVPARRSRLSQWRHLQAAFRQTLDERPLKAVHLHGFIPSILAERSLRSLGAGTLVFYSPHGSRSLESLRAVAALARILTRPLTGSLQPYAIANGFPEAKALRSMNQQPVRLVESPVSDAFFKITGHQARHPLIVTSSRSRDVRSVALFAQLAVLLGGEALRMSFNWLGSLDAVSHTRMKAANVGVFDVTSDEERASRLAAGWVYVALGGGRGFPLSMVEAMSVGLPCVAIDTAFHRDIVRHGETGYLCRSQTEVIDRIAQLIDTPSLRERMGLMARAVARERFSEDRFRDSLFAAYDLRDSGFQSQTTYSPAEVPMGRLKIETNSGFG